ncbi:hypothetical protein [Pseudomonas mangiferae]|uniref:DUF4148 domain-containing protein n=1 Tax=Pseudomonas mangiferae TaxID=2593654 RepID=A0A553GYM8_9PSED|nr:hypothetical protein [Pseudomonas mangiferae]TRX74607.1 hypothetical protein FM069_11405 [Pseudomonas mangiferae]
MKTLATALLSASALLFATLGHAEESPAFIAHVEAVQKGAAQTTSHDETIARLNAESAARRDS